ncbi:MAG: ketoacyl-ACP synthase III [Planctomycetia bacterium]|nr:ketoacyl-ACP synthase III [Planctomycetia bacterium]
MSLYLARRRFMRRCPSAVCGEGSSPLVLQKVKGDLNHMLKNAAIRAMTFAVPEKILDNTEILRRFPAENMESFLKVIGIQRRHVLSESESASDIAVLAAEELFEKTGLDRHSIDTIIYCSQTPDFRSPTTSCVLQNRLSLASDVCAFDMSQACPSFIHLMNVCNGLVASGSHKKILAFVADATTQLIHPQDGSQIPLHGDGAIAVLVEPAAENQVFFEWFDFGVDGSQEDRIKIPMGGSRMPYQQDKIKETVDGFGNVRTSLYSHMDGTAVFHFVIHTIPRFLKKICEKYQTSLEDYDLILFHQSNKMIVNMLYRILCIPEEKRFYCLENIGNLSGGSLPAALHEAIRLGRCGPGARILLVGYGAGLSWAASSFRLGNIIVGKGV